MAQWKTIRKEMSSSFLQPGRPLFEVSLRLAVDTSKLASYIFRKAEASTLNRRLGVDPQQLRSEAES